MNVLVIGRAERSVLVVAAIWQFVAWGGRVSLLTDAETSDWWSWVRIGGSLAAGVGVLAVGVGLVRRPGSARALAGSYLALGAVTWGRSLVEVWTQQNTAGFRLVHTVLALVTWGLGVGAVWATRRRPVGSYAGRRGAKGAA